MLKALCVLLMFVSGCVSSIPTPTAHLGPRIDEPTRTMFVIQCLQSNLPVTACLCFEEVIVRMKGTAEPTQLDMAVAQQKCMEVVEPIVRKELEKLQQELLEKNPRGKSL